MHRLCGFQTDLLGLVSRITLVTELRNLCYVLVKLFLVDIILKEIQRNKWRKMKEVMALEEISFIFSCFFFSKFYLINKERRKNSFII